MKNYGQHSAGGLLETDKIMIKLWKSWCTYFHCPQPQYLKEVDLLVTEFIKHRNNLKIYD